MPDDCTLTRALKLVSSGGVVLVESGVYEVELNVAHVPDPEP